MIDETEIFIIVARQRKLVEELELQIRNFGKDSASRKTQKYKDERIQRLQTLWVEFESNHLKIVPNIKQDTPYMQRNTFMKVKNLYEEHMKRLETLVPTISEYEKITTQNLGEDTTPIKKIPGPTTNTEETQIPSRVQETSTQSTSNNAKENESHNRIQIQRLKKLQLKISAVVDTMEEFEDSFEKYSKEIYEYQQKMLLEQLRNLTELHEDYISNADEEDLKVAYVTGNQYKGIKQDINRFLHQMASNLGDTKKSQDIQRKSYDSRLPQLKIPTFKGNFLEWKSFYDLFSTIIHEKSSLSSTEKMEYLKTHLEGEPLHLIQHFTFSSENYNSAWEILKSRYNNERKIVSMHIDKMLRGGQQGNSPSANTIKNILDAVKEGLAALNNMGFDTSSWSPIIVHLTTKTLDTESRNLFEQGLTEPNKMPVLKTLLDFLERRYQALEVLAPARKIQRSVDEPRHAVRNFHIDSKLLQCHICKGDHAVYTCPKFLNSSLKERWQQCKQAKLCVNCLRHDKQFQCYSKRNCQYCNKKHHSFLHMEWKDRFPQTKSTEPAHRDSTKMTTQVNHGEQNQSVLIATAIIKVKNEESLGKGITIRALIDPGSQASLVTESIAQTLRLKRQNVCVEVSGLGATNAGTARNKVNITITPRFTSKFKIQIEALVLPKLTRQLPSRTTKNIEIGNFDKLELADPSFNVPGSIDMIIGADAFGEIILDGIKRNARSTLIAQRSQLGWLISGRTTTEAASNYRVTGLVAQTSIEQQLEKFWEIEEVAQPKYQKEIDKECEKFYKDTHFRKENGKYVVKIPFDREAMEQLHLGDSKNRAIARFRQLETKLNQNLELKKEYENVINEFLELGHMIEAEPNLPQTDRTYYMPHHAVIKPSSTTTKLRVVFDGSAKSTTGVSLNQLMMVGPKLQDDITTILMRWRKHKYVFTSDIEKMYRQIDLHKDDQNYQRILWRSSCDQPIKEYKLTTVTYGTASAPYLAVKTLQQLAADEQNNYPVASDIVKHDFYVDDVMSGRDTISECRKAQKQLNEMLNGAGFHLRKWAANDPRLLEHIPIESRSQKEINIVKDETIKTLGIHWSPLSDTFQFKVNSHQNTSKEITLTKRNTLSEIAKLYDPLGWLAPVTVGAKILMQLIWKSEVGWDDQLPLELQNHWNKLNKNLVAVEKIRIPRWLETRKNQKIELHGFCDASEAAYAAVVYSRVVLPNGQFVTAILSAKTKVAPIRKKLPLPKLELCGAHLLSKLLADTTRTYGSQIGEVFAWTDSTITLAWIRKCPSTWKTFVANRVSEIQEATKTKSWRHVRSSDNPADLASRGCLPEELTNNQLWWSGPRWLQEDSVHWPSQEQCASTSEPDVPEARKVMTIAVHEVDDITERFSCYNKLIRVAAYCRRFVNNCKICVNRKKLGTNSINHEIAKETRNLTVKEIQDSRNGIIRSIQERVFPEEVTCLKDGKNLHKRSKILSLNPILNKDEILVVGGRLENANITSSEKHPFILPHNEKFTNLLVENAHKRTLHGGIRLTLTKLRQQFWILQAKRVVRRIIHQCVKCYRFNAQSTSQQMGVLPAARVTPSRPFTHTGIDYAGPIQVLVAKGRGNKSTKGYIAIFVCLATKAVHIELVSDLSSAAFLAALKRFTSRRGICSHFYSDNGTTFVGANKEIQHQMQATIRRSEEDASSKLVMDGIQWHFIPPAAPHFGGLWEAGVKSTKYHLKRVIGDTTLTFEELSTLLTQIEACLNSRPLSAVENDVNDTTILTSGHFLVGSALNAVPEPNIDETKTFRSRWQLLQKMTQDFWKTWSSEYLVQLQQRQKWKQKEDNIQIGDIVLIKEDRLPPTTWMMGKISEVHPGKDNGVRAATVFSRNKHIKRPITKLCRLPIETKQHESQQTTTKHSMAVTTKNIAPNRAHPLLWISIVFGLLNLVSSLPSTYQHKVEITPFESQPGIYFEDVGRASLISSSWKTIVFFNMTNYWSEFDTYKICVQQMEKICKSTVLPEVKLTMCDGILGQFKRQLQQIELNNEILVHANDDSMQRPKRSPFDFVGTITNELFGILDQRFAKQYEETIEAIQDNEKHVVQLMKNQTTIIDSTVNIFKKEHMETKKEIELLSTIVHKLSNDTDKYNNLKLFSATAINAILIMLNYQSTQNILLDMVLSTHNGRIHPLILTVQQFKDELTRIHDHIPRSLMIPGERHHESILQLYKTLSPRGRVTGSNIIIEITLPLLYNEEFKTYKILPVPTFNNGNFTCIIPSSDYLLVNLQGNHFYPMNKDAFSHCQKRPLDNYWCNLQHPIYTSGASVSSCEINIIQHKRQLMDSCLTNNIPAKAYWIQMHHPNAWIYSVPNTTVININCDLNPTPTILKGSGILKLPASCMIHDETMTVVGRQTVTSRLTSSFLPSFNLSEQLTSLNYKREEQPILQSDISLEIARVEQAIVLQRSQENILREIKTHRIHQYSVLGAIGILIVIIAIAAIIFKRNQPPKPRKRRIIFKPSKAANDIQMSQTSFEESDFCVIQAEEAQHVVTTTK